MQAYLVPLKIQAYTLKDNWRSKTHGKKDCLQILESLTPAILKSKSLDLLHRDIQSGIQDSEDCIKFCNKLLNLLKVSYILTSLHYNTNISKLFDQLTIVSMVIWINSLRRAPSKISGRH